MRRRLRAAGLVLLLGTGIALLAGCGSSGLPSGVVAQVGDAQITQTQLDQYMTQLAASSAAQGESFPTPGSANYPTAEADALQELIQDQIVGFEAAKCGRPCAVSDSEITAQLDEIAAQRFGGSQAKLVAYLAGLGYTLDQARVQVRTSLQQQKLQAYVEDGVTFTPAQAAAYYAAHQSLYNVPETRDVSHILVATKAEAEHIRSIVTLANFATLAKEYSIDTGSKDKGGSLGAIKASQVVAPFAKAAFSLKVDQISQPVHSQYGWHIILVTGIQPAHKTALATAITQIIKSQVAAKRAQAYTDWVDGVLADWGAQTKYASAVLEPSSSSTGAGTGG